MKNIIPFPFHRTLKPKSRDDIKLIFCRNCLRKRCEGLLHDKKGEIRMTVMVCNHEGKPFKAGITIHPIELKALLNCANSGKFVDLAGYAVVDYLESYERQEG